ncbi:Amino acid transporter AVT1J [Vitis vinifera]|uniref:Amino acid transporter AVT1J n=1 Tax=Vitis vinifera TaxID=29760 RepID=A0A438CNE3_VITVI|nr:Amino acid transporter AVT1J [Vitis vinifera]
MANNELRIPLQTPTTGSSSFLKACFNGTNAFLGIGLLTVPYALSSGGWLSLILFFLIAIMTFYTGILLKRWNTSDVKSLPTGVSLYIVCFAGHPVIPSIYTSMRNTYQFSKVLLFSFVLTTFTYLAMAMVGYLMYGDSVESQITLSLPTSKVCAEVAIYTTLLIPITRYALMVTPVATAIEGGLSENYKNQRTVRLLIRVGLLISTVIVAYVFPYYESLMAIVGSIFVVSASFLLPCLCYLRINSDLRWGWNCEQMGIVGILVFGTLAGVLGTYSSVYDLVT